MASKAVWGYSREFLQACRAELSVTPEELNGLDAHYFVAEDGEGLAGYYALVQAEEGLELDALFIAPDRLRRGLGKALLRHAEATALGLGARSIIIQGDPHAEGFYLSAGAARIGERPSASVSGRNLPLFRLVCAP